jgi:3D-(3,5/4)-trihydroxycyclohexane-1,2-dione acylhydrolase (decyclizing)
VADAREALTALTAALGEAGYQGTDSAFRGQVGDLRAQWNAAVDQHRADIGPEGDLHQPGVIGVVNDAFGGTATMINAAGSLPGDLLKLWRPEDSRAYHLEYGYSCMGYEIPAGIGVKLAEPEREVVVFIGDGTYLMLNSEIVTAVAEGIRMTVIVIDNHGYQCIRDLQQNSGVPSFGNDLRFRDPARNRLTGPYVPVDFAKHAEAMGALSLVATTEAEIRDAIATARAADRITVITIPVSPDVRVPGFEAWWDVPPVEVTAEGAVLPARERYEAAVTRQRLDLA